MKRISYIILFSWFILACSEGDEGHIDPFLFNGPFELISDKFSLCSSETTELKLYSFAINGKVERLPTSELLFESIPKDDGSLTNDNFFVAPKTISYSKVIFLKARLRRKPSIKFSIPIELVSPNSKGSSYQSVSGFSGSSPYNQIGIADINEMGEFLIGQTYTSGPGKFSGGGGFYDSLGNYKGNFPVFGRPSGLLAFLRDHVISCGANLIPGGSYINDIYNLDGQFVKNVKFSVGQFPFLVKKNKIGDWILVTKSYFSENNAIEYQAYKVSDEMDFIFWFKFNLSSDEGVEVFYKESGEIVATDKNSISLYKDGIQLWQSPRDEFDQYASVFFLEELPNGNVILISSEIDFDESKSKWGYQELDKSNGRLVRRIPIHEGRTQRLFNRIEIGDKGKTIGYARRVLVTKNGNVWVLGYGSYDGRKYYLIKGLNGERREFFGGNSEEIGQPDWFAETGGYIVRFMENEGGIKFSEINSKYLTHYQFGQNLEFNPCK